MAESPLNSFRPTNAPRSGFVAPAPLHVPATPHAAADKSAASHAHVNLERCRLSLIKGEHRWRFRWEPGCEAAVISAVADLARNPHMNFDWFDAAVVCRHIAQGLPAQSPAKTGFACESAASAPRADSRHQK